MAMEYVTVGEIQCFLHKIMKTDCFKKNEKKHEKNSDHPWVFLSPRKRVKLDVLLMS